MFPITADDMVRMVTFIDYGTIEQNIEFDWKNFRAAPGSDLRVAVPAMGPARWHSTLPFLSSMQLGINGKSSTSRWASRDDHRLRCRSDQYAGPLDLLLYLVRREELDVTEVSLAKITRQYCDFLELHRSD